MKAALIVGLGSFIGGTVRYLATVWVERKFEGAFPIGVLAVNALGSFLIGLITAGFERMSAGAEPLMLLFLTAGIMGGFTTFSAFSLQTMRLLQSGNWGLAGINALSSVACCLIAVFAGWRLGQIVFPSGV